MRPKFKNQRNIYKAYNEASFLECCRKPRINSQLVAQQVAQQYATPPPPKKEKKEKVEKQDKEKPQTFPWMNIVLVSFLSIY